MRTVTTHINTFVDILAETRSERPGPTLESQSFPALQKICKMQVLDLKHESAGSMRCMHADAHAGYSRDALSSCA